MARNDGSDVELLPDETVLGTRVGHTSATGHRRASTASLIDPPGKWYKLPPGTLHKFAIVALLICMWYLFSVCLSMYNKWMFSARYLNFQFPLFVTSLHMVIQFFLAHIVLTLVPRLRVPPGARGLTRDMYAKQVAPCGVSTGLDIGLSNASLQTITLSFYTMVKSSSLAFVLLFAFLLRLERFRIDLILVMAVITAGVVMMVATETRFVMSGFFLVLAGSFFGGLRWALTQLLLIESAATSNPFLSIRALTPVMFATLFLVALVVEGPLRLVHSTFWAAYGLLSIPILLFPGAFAFCMISTEFALIQRTSVVTLSVAGIFKEVCTIAISAAVYGDELTPVNISGLCTALLGIAGYNYIRISRVVKSDGERDEYAHDDRGTSYAHVSTSDSEDDPPTDTFAVSHDTDLEEQTPIPLKHLDNGAR